MKSYPQRKDGLGKTLQRDGELGRSILSDMFNTTQCKESTDIIMSFVTHLKRHLERVYSRWELQIEDVSYDVRFVTAKSRVTPLKKLTLPRLVFQTAVVAVRLDATIREETTLQLRETVFNDR